MQFAVGIGGRPAPIHAVPFNTVVPGTGRNGGKKGIIYWTYCQFIARYILRVLQAYFTSHYESNHFWNFLAILKSLVKRDPSLSSAPDVWLFCILPVVSVARAPTDTLFDITAFKLLPFNDWTGAFTEKCFPETTVTSPAPSKATIPDIFSLKNYIAV
jgi:hypothetical protein